MVEVRPMFQSGGGAPSRVIITAPTPGAPTTFLSASELQKKENKAIQLLFFKPKGTMQPMTVTVNPAQVAGGLGAPAPSIMPPSVIVEEPVAPLDLSCRKREPSGGGEEEPSPSPPLVPKVETVLLPMAPVAGPSLPTQPLPQQLGQLMPLPPGHLTVNNICSSLDEPQFIPRSNSDASTCSNASSTMSGFEDRKQKRKEQNKAAAQTYRQRKKSFSDKIDSEYDILSRKNGQLKTQKNLLEGQISRMRFLLNEQIKEEKKGSKEPLRPRASSLSWHPGRNAPPVAVTRLAPISQLTVSPIAETPEGPPASSTQVSPALPPPAPPMPTSPSLAPATVIMAAPAPVSSPPQPNFSTSSLMPTADDFSTVGPMRSRKYTWPMTLTGKDRKKEQNKLASRRFRQRRKQEMSHCDVEAAVLENNNKRLREHCDALESKINLLKDFINKVNAKTGTDLVATARAKQQQQPAAMNAAKALSTLSLHSPPRRSSVEEEEEEAME